MRSRVFSYLIIIVFCFFGSCKKENTGDDQRPVINSISVNPDTATPGEKISVTGSASDPQGDNLTYLWAVSQGTLSDPSSPSTQWTISPVVRVNANSKISLTVSDGIYSSTAEKNVMISMGLNVTGRVLYAGTTIPISGLSVKLGPFSTVTGEDGKFVFPHITPGPKTLEAYKSGFDLYQKTENISVSNNVFNISITSNTETRKISGKAKTFDNIFLNGIRVAMLNDDNTESSLIDTTDNSGEYEIKSVPPGIRTFKFTNVSNPNNCKLITYSVNVNDQDQSFDANIMIERDIDMLQNGWEFFSADLSAPFNGTAYVLTSNSTSGNRYFRPAFCCPIPAEAENPVVMLTHRLTGTLRVQGGYYFKSPASSQFYISSNCSTWVDYSINTNYSSWSSPISTFFSEYRSLASSYKGKSVKFTFGLFRYNGSMPQWEIKSLVVTYFY